MQDSSNFKILPILPLLSDCPPQIQRRRELGIDLQWRRHHRTGCMPESKEPRRTASFRLVGVHGECFVVATARMRNVIRTTSDGALLREIDHIEHKWCMHRNCGM